MEPFAKFECMLNHSLDCCRCCCCFTFHCFSGTGKDLKGTAFVVYEGFGYYCFLLRLISENASYADIFDAKKALEHLSGFNVGNRYIVVLYYNKGKMEEKRSIQERKKEVEKLKKQCKRCVLLLLSLLLLFVFVLLLFVCSHIYFVADNLDEEKNT
jgi:hypothetical protein